MTRWTTTLTASAVEGLVATARRVRPELPATPPTLVGEGISTITYGWSTPDGGWVLRVSRRHPEPWTWRGGRRHEAGLVAALRTRGVPVPADPAVVDEVDGLPTAILERRVVGTPLTADLVSAERRLVVRIAAVLDRLHTFPVEDAVARGVARDDPTAEFRQALASVDLADEALRLRVEAAIVALESRSSIRTLCHRDFRCEHLIVADDGDLAGLLDLGEVGIDDPAVDLAFLHGELGAETVAEICAAMHSADAGLGAAARTIHSLWPLLELAPGGETWGDPATAPDRLRALI